MGMVSAYFDFLTIFRFPKGMFLRTGVNLNQNQPEQEPVEPHRGHPDKNIETSSKEKARVT